MINKIVDILAKLFKKNKQYIKDFFSKVWEIIFKPETLILPGQLSFFVILSVVPIVSIITWIGTMLGISIETVTDLLGKVFTSVNFDMFLPSIVVSGAGINDVMEQIV